MKKKIGFEEIDRARRVLALDEHASMQEIKDAYRHLAARYHPDRCKKRELALCEKKIREINLAKDLLMAYCANYRYSFGEKDATRNAFEKEEYEHLKQFYDGWIAEL
ncbi:MAG: DnaJ domain-containing protein [Candidatus Omnitrophica bacterium]|nr:DnaJ domain-containing protein [Candidatus Omnitrophota bacterium]